MSLRSSIAGVAACILSAILLVGVPAPPALAQPTSPEIARGPSGLPLPRFVSLKSPRVNLRVGPGVNYPVDWTYLKSGLPMEIIQEYDNWRRVRDAEGAEGWVNQSLLSGARTAIVAPWHRGRDAEIALMAEPSEAARQVARLEPGLMGTIRMCNGEWCELDFSGVRGFVRQSVIWGAYPGETYRD